MNLDTEYATLVGFLKTSITGTIDTIAIIGSYLIDGRVKPGSDVDILVVVNNLDEIDVDFDSVFYKNERIDDSVGDRREVNVKFNGLVLDITIIDHFNTANNPLLDSYENAIGTALKALTIYGEPLADRFKLDSIIESYKTIQPGRLEKVNQKIAITKQKIREQGRRDLHIIYELQKYIFIRECIRQNVFNYISIKHPSHSIKDFDDIFARDLRECGIEFSITSI